MNHLKIILGEFKKSLIRFLTPEKPIEFIERIVRSSYYFMLKDYGFKITERKEGSFCSASIVIENEKLAICFMIDGRDNLKDILLSKPANKFESPHERCQQNLFDIRTLINLLEQLGYNMKGIVCPEGRSKDRFDKQGVASFENYVLFFKQYLSVLYEYFMTDKYGLLIDMYNSYYGLKCGTKYKNDLL